ncbi:MAG: NADPH-dependent F420 reductase [Sphingomonadaceae bacterium]
MAETGTKVAVLGGGGALGSGLARRLAAAGHPVVIGSRDPSGLTALVAELRAASGGGMIEAAGYAEAAAQAGIVLLTVPFAAQRPTLEAVRPHLAGKLLIDCTVPLVPPKVGLVQLPAAGSAAVLARDAVGEGVDVASAFHNVSAKLLQAEGPIDCDILVFADEAGVRARVSALVELCGLNPIEGGPLANSAAAEALTSVLIQINRRYRSGHAGIRITGLGYGGAH